MVSVYATADRVFNWSRCQYTDYCLTEYESDEDPLSDDYFSDDEYDKSKVHWARRLNLQHLIAFLKALVVHGVFDLGFKSSDLPRFCPFEKYFLITGTAWGLVM